MRILIHTYGRSNRQTTWENLPPEIQKQTDLVVQIREAHLYPGYPIIVLPPEITKLADTREYIFSTFSDDYICILDDDLVFATRRVDVPTRFYSATPEDIIELFQQIRWCVQDRAPLVGVGAREGGNYHTAPELYATRQMRIHAINAKLYRQLGIKFNRVEVMEDFDVTLQFLEAGYANLVLNRWVTNQHGSNTLGGCSHYRTPEVQSASAEKLAQLHPGLVTILRKKTRTSWNGEERTDVRISWKKAFNRRVSLLDNGKGVSTQEEGSGGTEAVEQ